MMSLLPLFDALCNYNEIADTMLLILQLVLHQYFYIQREIHIYIFTHTHIYIPQDNIHNIIVIKNILKQQQIHILQQ